MATPSRRTPPELLAAVREGLGDAPGFVWDGAGRQPLSRDARARRRGAGDRRQRQHGRRSDRDRRPVHIFEPSGGGSKKLGGAIDALIAKGAARRFAGRIEPFSYAPIDSSGEIAREIARRFGAMRAGR